MNYDFKQLFENECHYPRDWMYYIDEVYDFINLFVKQVENYKKFFENYVSENILTDDEIKLACKNLLYIANIMSYFPSNERELNNIVFSIFKPMLKNTNDFSCNIDIYIGLLNRLMDKEKLVLNEYEKKRDEYFDKQISTFSRINILDFDEIHKEWQEERTKIIESNQNVRWAKEFSKFYDDVITNHKEEIKRNKQTDEYNKRMDESIMKLIKEIDTRLNKI